MRITGTEPFLAAGPCRLWRGAARSIPAKSPAGRAAWRWSPRFPACRAPQPDVVAALVPLHRRLAHAGEPRGRPAERCGETHATARYVATISDNTAEAVAALPAPGPTTCSADHTVGIDGDGIITPITCATLSPCAPWWDARAALMPSASSPLRPRASPDSRARRRRRVGRREARKCLQHRRALVDLVPKARLVSRASLWAVSKPPMSKVGSASA